MKQRSLFALAVFAAAALTGTACMDGGMGRVTLGFSNRPASAGSVSSASGSAVFVLGDDTIIVRTVEMVLREIELKPEEDVAGCMDSEAEGEHEDQCEEIETGPMLIDLDLTAAVEHAITVNLSAGTFDQLEFKIQARRRIG